MFGVISGGPCGHREWYDSFEDAAAMLRHEWCYAVIQKLWGTEYVVDGYAVDQDTLVNYYDMPVIPAPR